MSRLTLVLLFIAVSSIHLLAQKDTEFWFVAPEITKGANDYDRPVAFRFSTYSAAATVTLSQPANPGFVPIVLNMAPNSSDKIQFPPFFDDVENTPPATILNKGFLIEATSPITASYEIISTTLTNPELFALKGRNALGTQFVIPIQNIIDNANAPSYFPLPHSAFDLVASEDNTTVNITPSKDIVGHAAGVPFSITLNRGQTYSAEAVSQAASEHPSGSLVSADKPIAITIKDDLLESGIEFGGFCRDMIGDQIVPVEKTGTKYVVQKGLLNISEYVFIFGTQDGTQILYNGVPAGTVNTGETLALSVTGQHFIESSQPVYVWQITGNGCEVGAALMPALDCSGSSSIRFVRPTSETFLLFLTTEAGNEDSFTLNGSGTAILPSAFSVVPGSNGQYVSAIISLNTIQVPDNASSVIENTSGLFQMGFLNGASLATGCRYGYFSDFGNQIVIVDSISFCSGSSVTTHGITIDTSGVFEVIGVNSQGCDTLFQFIASLIDPTITQEYISLCPGESITINGELYTQAGTVSDTLTSSSGCDSIITYTLTQLPNPTDSVTIPFCPGSTVTINGVVYDQPGVVLDTVAASSGCDTIVVYNLVSQLPAPSVVSISCPNNINLIADPGTTPLLVDYTMPMASSDCPCPGVSVALTSGLAPGNLFPGGLTEVCYEAEDVCGQTASCCFTVNVREIQPCDVKVNGCMKYELLSITADPGQNLTYRIRVTNNCQDKLIYTAIQIPDGMVALEPEHLSVFTSETGRDYDIRNPNYSPFYSIRYKSTTDSISNGESDIFRYTLPAQANVTYININSRLVTQQYFEAHLNTFYCPIGITPSGNRDNDYKVEPTRVVSLYPNPATGLINLVFDNYADMPFQWQIMNLQGRLMASNSSNTGSGVVPISLPASLPDGLYLLDILYDNGEKRTLRFVIQG